jgi:copper chaperone CopZ
MHSDGKAIVTYDPEKVTPQQMIDAVKGAGYKAYPPKE